MTAERQERIARALADYAGPAHAALRMLIVELATDAEGVEARDALIATLTSRLGLLEAAVEEVRQAGKRQAGPFSKRAPKPDPKTSGRKPGEGYGPGHTGRCRPAAPMPSCVANFPAPARTAGVS
ncbi:MAG TPA: hypothetical protein VGS62_09545 [Streptosporangiaceae bacterium]|nr:hypothetical protein [Streptosporangiaceae bacterium]